MVSPEIHAKLERLAAAEIEIVPVADLTTYFVLARPPWAALVERSSDGFGNVGAAGRLTDHGFAMLVWREGQPYFQVKHWSLPATERDVADLRAFSHELKAALGR